MQRLCVVLLLLMVVSNAHAENESVLPAKMISLEDCSIMRIFARVWKYTPLVETERAVWIVLDANGEYTAIDWFVTPERRMATWSEIPPQNVIAQAHTHGDMLDPKPSSQDVNVAKKMNVPVYVLARKGIWKAAPDGSIAKQTERGWFDETVRKCGKVAKK